MTGEFFEAFGPNAGYVEELYRQFLTDPQLVDSKWSSFFKDLQGKIPGSAEVWAAQTTAQTNGAAMYHNGHASRDAAASDPAALVQALERQAQIEALVRSYRTHGHLKARVNPLHAGVKALKPPEDLVPPAGVSRDDQVFVGGFSGERVLKFGTLLERLEDVYCGSIGFEYIHLTHAAERKWLQERIESRGARFATHFSAEQRKRFYKKLHDSEALESELHRKYVGSKRFSLQGGDTLIPMLDVVLDDAAQRHLKEVVIGMAHRGRVNVLANIGGKRLQDIFSEFEDTSMASVIGAGDVKYHLGISSTCRTFSGREITVSLAPNPSHLEFVNPVVQGIVRARQDQDRDGRFSSLPVLIHGDAAFIGQGVVSETLNFSGAPGYSTGGTIHVIINNQVGFTTDAAEGRSSYYCSDIAKIVEAPVLHVNAEDVDAACWAARLALEFREEFHRDVVIDLYCFRRYGHNEGDDPSFTQPLMYGEIKSKPTLSETYAQRLIAEGVLQSEDRSQIENSFKADFEAATLLRYSSHVGEACPLYGKLGFSPTHTAVSREMLERISAELLQYPQSFSLHPKLRAILEKRGESLREGKGIDWGFAEALAYGSLLTDGVSVRLSGQDAGRGTFSHRHAELHDYSNGERFYPLAALAERSASGARFEVFNSTLSETGVLGFEFGYAATHPKALVLWEAQFGDFANGAQVIIDQFIAASEVKWGQRSGVTLLLPHGYEGQGPEHSSARLERFLQLCAEGNMTVVYPTTAAQHFHLLRRQGISELKRPLVVMTPKSLLRLPDATARVEDITEGGFRRVIADKFGKGSTQTVVLLSGKVFYDVQQALKSHEGSTSVHVLRIEELYPFPEVDLRQALLGIQAKKFLWVQEEPQNMGAWSYIAPRLESLLGTKISYFGRAPSASPACGSLTWHGIELKRFISDMLGAIA